MSAELWVLDRGGLWHELKAEGAERTRCHLTVPAEQRRYLATGDRCCRECASRRTAADHIGHARARLAEIARRRVGADR